MSFSLHYVVFEFYKNIVSNFFIWKSKNIIWPSFCVEFEKFLIKLILKHNCGRVRKNFPELFRYFWSETSLGGEGAQILNRHENLFPKIVTKIRFRIFHDCWTYGTYNILRLLDVWYFTINGRIIFYDYWTWNIITNIWLFSESRGDEIWWASRNLWPRTSRKFDLNYFAIIGLIGLRIFHDYWRYNILRLLDLKYYYKNLNFFRVSCR